MGHSITLQDGIAQRGWTTHAASSHPCQQPGWALGFPSGSVSPAAGRASSIPAPGLSQHIRLLERVGSRGDGSWGILDLLGAVPVSAHPITVTHHPRVGPAPCPCPPSPSTAHFLSLDVIRVWEHPREHPPRPGTSRGVLGARPPLHRTGMPFVLLGVRGNSAALGFSLLFWKFKTFAGRPTRALPPRREALG